MIYKRYLVVALVAFAFGILAIRPAQALDNQSENEVGPISTAGGE